MKAAKVINGTLGLFVALPMWFFIMYTVIAASNPDRLVWAVFIAYIPVCVIIRILAAIIEASDA